MGPQAAREALAVPWLPRAWLYLAERPRWPGSGAAREAALEPDPESRCGGAGLQLLEAALGRRAGLPAPGPRLVAAPASAADACRQGSVWGGGECEYI